VQSHFAESEPVVRVKFARLFKTMAEQIENDDTAVFRCSAASARYGRTAWCRAWLKIARSTVPFATGGS
jgi:hypothetical protein